MSFLSTHHRTDITNLYRRKYEFPASSDNIFTKTADVVHFLLQRVYFFLVDVRIPQERHVDKPLKRANLHSFMLMNHENPSVTPSLLTEFQSQNSGTNEATNKWTSTPSGIVQVCSTEWAHKTTELKSVLS